MAVRVMWVEVSGALVGAGPGGGDAAPGLVSRVHGVLQVGWGVVGKGRGRGLTRSRGTGRCGARLVQGARGAHPKPRAGEWRRGEAGVWKRARGTAWG